MSNPSNPVEAGADIDAYCNRCKLSLAHVIIAMRGSRPARVQCKTCGSSHAYKSEAPERRPTRRSTTRPAANLQLNYETLMEGRDISGAIRYKAGQQFALDDMVDHKTFGLGLVTKVLADKKIEVAFQAGHKILVHSR